MLLLQTSHDARVVPDLTVPSKRGMEEWSAVNLAPEQRSLLGQRMLSEHNIDVVSVDQVNQSLTGLHRHSAKIGVSDRRLNAPDVFSRLYSCWD